MIGAYTSANKCVTEYNMVLSGCSASQIGAMAGVSKVAVTGWVKIADEQGFEALRPKGHKGRAAKLTEEQLKEIDGVLQSDPKDYGYKNWDGPALSAYIQAKYNISLSVRQCQRLFHNLGFSHIRPQPYPSKGYEDSEKRNEFKKTLRNRSRRHRHFSLSRRSSFSDTNNHHLRVV